MSFRLVSYQAPKGNVGDDFSGWLFSRALGPRLDQNGEILLFGVGSILTKAYEAEWRDTSIHTCAVFGSGARGPDSLPDMGGSDWKVYCVRGPLTAQVAGLPYQAAIADPAVLAPLIEPTRLNTTGPVGIVPYFTASETAWTKVANKLDWRIISPRLSVEKFVGALAECSRVWCESMHGAIFADAYGIPWRPISATSLLIERRTHAFKWTDFSAALGLPFDPLMGFPLPQRPNGLKISLKESIKIEIMAKILFRADREDRHVLSDRTILADRQDRLLKSLELMCYELSGEPSSLTFPSRVISPT